MSTRLAHPSPPSDRNKTVAAVHLENIFKRYKGTAQPAVDDVSLSVQDGEFMVLLGPSGCGKSTTLRMIAGLEAITEGSLAIDARKVNEVPAKDRDIAMVFQSYALYPHMTVAENLSFGLRRRKVDRGHIAARVKSAADILGLNELLARKPAALSGGQRQRVALGRAIVREPKVFLFDEPLSNLDAALRVNTRNELVRLHHRLGATMIYVTHDQVEALTFAEEVVVMTRGKAVQVGSAEALFERPAHTFVGHFIGSPGMNFLSAKNANGALEVAGTPLVPTRELPQGALKIGIRPEYLRLSNAGAAGAVPALVRQVQDVGTHAMLSAEVDGGVVKVRLHSEDQPPGVGDTVWLRVLDTHTCYYKDEELVA